MTAIAAPAAGGDRLTRILVTTSVMMATTVVILDQTIASIALPHMQGGLSANQDQIGWVMTTYFMAQAITTACTGWIAGRLGRRRTYLIALVGFSVFAMLSGSATSLTEIMIYRTIQGMFSAPVIPISQSLILDSYPRERHGEALAVWGTGVMFAPVMGPVVGGWLTDGWGWEWVFYVGVPFAGLALLTGWSSMKETAIDRDRRFDWFGFTCLAVALASLQLMLDRGEFKGWFSSEEILIELVLVLLGLYLFVVHTATTKNPFISRTILRDRNIMLGLIFMWLLGICVLSMNVILPLFMQNLRGFPVLTAGLIMVPRGLGTFVALLLAGWIVKHIDGRFVIALGFGCVAWSSWQFSTFTPDVGIWLFMSTVTFNGLGIGFIFVPLTTIAFETLPPEYRTEGSTLTSLARNYGSGMGISIVVSVLSRTSTISRAEMVEQITPYHEGTTSSLPPAWSLNSPEGLAALERVVEKEAQVIGFLNDFYLIAIASAVVIPLIFFLRTGGALKRHATASKDSTPSAEPPVTNSTDHAHPQ